MRTTRGVEHTLDSVRTGRKARGSVHVGIHLALGVRSLRIAAVVVVAGRSSRRRRFAVVVGDIVGCSPGHSLVREGRRSPGLVLANRTGLVGDIAAGRSPGCIGRKVRTLWLLCGSCGELLCRYCEV